MRILEQSEQSGGLREEKRRDEGLHEDGMRRREDQVQIKEENSAGVPLMVVDTSGVVVRYFPGGDISTYRGKSGNYKGDSGAYREREQGDQGSHSTGVNTDTSDGLPSP